MLEHQKAYFSFVLQVSKRKMTAFQQESIAQELEKNIILLVHMLRTAIEFKINIHRVCNKNFSSDFYDFVL